MVHWLLDSAGFGSLVVVVVAGAVLAAYIAMVRWIARAPRDGDEMRGPLP